MRTEIDGGVALVLVDVVSDELGEQLRERLSAYCYGAANVDEDADYYSFEQTIEELLVRYESKPSATRIGMAGELLVHVLVSHTHPEMTSSAVFLNKEERSIKKGFDLTFHTAEGGAVWYGEVKSGLVKDPQSADEKSAALLKTAAADVADKLGKGAQRSRWDSAVADAYLTLEGAHAASAKALLRNDATEVAAGSLTTKNVVVAAVVMHEIDHCEISGDTVRKVASALNSAGRFSNVAVLVAQQHEIETLIDHLREVIASA